MFMSDELEPKVEQPTKKQRHFDKPRITSTVIIGIFLLIGMFLAIVLAGTSWAAVKEAADAAKESQEDAAGQVVGGAAVAFAGALGIVLVFIVYIGVTIDMAILLPFSIKNRKSKLKPIRIISYVFDGLIGATLLLSIIKMILFIAGV